MSSLEIGAIRAIDARIIRLGGGTSEKPAKPATAPPDVQRSDALEVGQPPIDPERVAVIRKAIESGTYPIVPAKIADAIIAAGLLLRAGK